MFFVLPSVHRLRAKREFKAALSAKRIFNCRYFFVIGLPVRPNTAQPIPTQFGFIISKKVHKRAVKRNQIRRRLREWIRLALKQGQISHLNAQWGPYRTLIFIAKSDAVLAEYTDLSIWMERFMLPLRPPIG